MINKSRYFLAAVAFLGSMSCAVAECSRSDVAYFIKKGFSRAQITAICTPASTQRLNESATQSAKDYKSYGKELETRLRIERKLQREEDDIALLKAAIAAEDIRVTSKWLDFKDTFCIAAGNNPDVGSRIRVCPQVLYRIYFKGLIIKDYERKYLLFGSREIEVEGTVKRKLLHDFKEYPTDIRKRLLDSYKATIREGGTFIPIRKDYPVSRVQEVLRSYAVRAEK